MSSTEERIDKRVGMISMVVIFIAFTIAYIVYDYNYGKLNEIIVSNNINQRHIISSLNSIKNIKNEPSPTQIESSQPQPVTNIMDGGDNWKVIDDSALGSHTQLYSDDGFNNRNSDFYKQKYHQYAVDDDLSYGMM